MYLIQSGNVSIKLPVAIFELLGPVTNLIHLGTLKHTQKIHKNQSSGLQLEQ